MKRRFLIGVGQPNDLSQLRFCPISVSIVGGPREGVDHDFHRTDLSDVLAPKRKVRPEPADERGMATIRIDPGEVVRARTLIIIEIFQPTFTEYFGKSAGRLWLSHCPDRDGAYRRDGAPLPRPWHHLVQNLHVLRRGTACTAGRAIRPNS